MASFPAFWRGYSRNKIGTTVSAAKYSDDDDDDAHLTSYPIHMITDNLKHDYDFGIIDNLIYGGKVLC